MLSTLKKVALGGIALFSAAQASQEQNVLADEATTIAPCCLFQNALPDPERVTVLSLPNALTEWDQGALKAFSNLLALKVHRSGRLQVEQGLTLTQAHFEQNAKLETVELPDTVTAMASSTFLLCPHLKIVRLSASLKTIGLRSFRDLSELAEVDFSRCSALETIQGDAFHGCTSLTSLKLPETIKAMGLSVFEGCSGLKQLELQDCKELKKINSRVFAGCSNLDSVNLPPLLEEIGIEAFGWCFKLTSITLPATVKEIGQRAFYNCVSQVIWEGNPARVCMGTESFFLPRVKHYYREEEELKEFLSYFRKQPTSKEA